MRIQCVASSVPAMNKYEIATRETCVLAVILTSQRSFPPNTRIPLPLRHPFLSFHHDSSQYPVDSRLIARTFGLEPVHYFNIHAQRDSPLSRPVPARLRAVSPSASNNKSSSTDARRSLILSGRGRDFFRFAFLGLAVMTLSCTPCCHDVAFLREHGPVRRVTLAGWAAGALGTGPRGLK